MVTADHLEVPRQHGLFFHHGIYLGDGTVAHYLEGREILKQKETDNSTNGDISFLGLADQNESEIKWVQLHKMFDR